MRKPAFCICENKDADQLRGNREADQRLCFRYTDSTISLQPKYEISSPQPSSVAVQPDLCGAWTETPKTGFLTTRFIVFLSLDTALKVLTVHLHFQIADNHSKHFLPKQYYANFIVSINFVKTRVMVYFTVPIYKNMTPKMKVTTFKSHSVHDKTCSFSSKQEKPVIIE